MSAVCHSSIAFKASAPLVVIGSGLAAQQVIKQVRKFNTERPIHLICADSGDFYSKPMLSNAFKQNKQPAQLIMQNVAQWSAALNVSYQTHTQVLEIDRERRLLITDQGEQAYSDCVLAVGASPRPLSCPGGDLAVAINDWSAYAKWQARLAELMVRKSSEQVRVAVIGAGLVGCEFANDLRSLGVQVILFSPQPECLFPVFPPHAGAVLRDALKQQGVQCVMPSAVQTIETLESGYLISGAGFAPQQVDLVLSSTGLIANTDLAARAGLAVAGGIKVNAELATEDKHIFALGDCAEIAGQSLRYILPIMQSAQALAHTLNGTPTRVQFPVMPILLKTPACPMLTAHAAAVLGEWRWEGVGNNQLGWCYDAEGKPINFVLTGTRLAEKSACLKQISVQ